MPDPITYYGDEAEQSFFNDDGPQESASSGFQNTNVSCCAEDGWDHSYGDQDEYEIWGELVNIESSPNAATTPLLDDQAYEDWGAGYEEPDVTDFEWSGPIQPNAPPAIAAFDEPVWDWDDSVDQTTIGSSFQNTHVTACPFDEAWDWHEEYEDDYLLVFDIALSANGVAPQVPAIVDAWDHAEPDETDDFYEDAAQSAALGPNQVPPPEDAWDHAEPDQLDDFERDASASAPVVPNAPPAVTLNDDLWEWDDEAEPLAVPSGYQAVDSTSVSALTYDEGYDHAEPDHEDPWAQDVSDSAPVGASVVVATVMSPEDPWDWDADATEFFADHFANVDADNPVLQVEWNYWDEIALDSWESGIVESFVGSSAVQALQQDDIAHLGSDEDVDEFFADDFGNVDVDACPSDDAWDWHEEVDDDTSLYAQDAISPPSAGQLPSNSPEDAWDHAEPEQIDDFYEDAGSSAPVVPNAPVFTPNSPEDAWDWAEPDQEDNAGEHDAAQSDPVGPNVSPVPEDPWDTHEEIEDGWDSWPLFDPVGPDNLLRQSLDNDWDFDAEDVEDEFALGDYANTPATTPPQENVQRIVISLDQHRLALALDSPRIVKSTDDQRIVPKPRI